MRIVLSLFLLLFGIGCHSVCNVACENPSNEVRYLAVHQGVGQGFANRMRALASGYVMAKLTSRILILDWQEVPGEIPVTFNDLFKNSFKTPSHIVLPEGWTYDDLINSDKPDDKIVARYRFLYQQDNENRSNMLCSCAKIVVVSSYFRFLPGDKEFEDIKPLYAQFLRSLEPVDAISEKVEKFKQENFTKQAHMVGVHFRSFQLGAADAIYYHPDPEQQYQDLICAMDESIKMDQDTQFFVATDSLPYLERLQEKYKDRIVSRAKQAERATKEGQQEALVDWYLLGATNYVIGTFQSSFSDEAALLTLTREKIDFGQGYVGSAFRCGMTFSM